MTFYKLGRMYASRALFPPVETKPFNWFGTNEGWELGLVMRFGISPGAFRHYSQNAQKEILKGIIDSAGYVVKDEVRLDVATKEAGDWLVQTFRQVGLPTEQALDKRRYHKTIPGEKVRTVTVESSPEIIKKVLS